MVLSGRTGLMVGDRYLEIPNSKETYMSPVMYHRPSGTDIILFGSGGETIPGQLDKFYTSFFILLPAHYIKFVQI